MKILVKNRKVNYEYHILDKYVAGIILTGNEVKSIRNGGVSLVDCFIYINDNEVFVKNMIISPYKMAHPASKHDEKRDKKLLLTKQQIGKIQNQIREKGITCVPTLIGLKDGRIKVEIAVVQGKKLYDKREGIKNKDIKRDIQREMKSY